MRRLLRSLRILALAGVALAIPGVRLEIAEAAPPTFTVLGNFPVGGAEIGSATPDGRYFAVTGGTRVALLDLQNLAAPFQTCAYDTTALGEPTSVAVHPSGAYAVTVIKNDPNPGRIAAFAIPTCAELWTLQVGIGPDSVVITPNGRQAVIAIEDEETEIDDPAVCPNVRPGRVDVVRLPDAVTQTPILTAVPLNITNLAGVNCPNDPQPEGIAISPDSYWAYVTLQENNALVVINLLSLAQVSAISMGTTTHLADVVHDNIAAVDDPFTGRREPDGIALSRDGRWLFTADEGDTDNTAVFSGGRTMSVLQAARWANGRPNSEVNGTLPPVVRTDTGAQIELQAAANNSLRSSRADDRGPEPEGITTFKLTEGEYAAVTLERSDTPQNPADSLIIFDITNPLTPTAIAFIKVGDAPESVTFLPSRRVLVVTNEDSGSITIICVNVNGQGCV